MKLSNVSQLYISELRDLHNASGRILDALPKFSRATTSQQLAGYLKGHLGNTKAQINRLNGMFEDLDQKTSGSRGNVMGSMILEVHESLEDAEQGPVMDAALIAGMHGIEHTMIADFNTALSYAKALGNTNHAALLKLCLNEEYVSAKEVSAFLPGLLEECDHFTLE